MHTIQQLSLRKKLTVAMILLIGVFSIVLLVQLLSGSDAPQPNHNRLALGSDASRTTISLPIIKAQSFSGLSRQEILSIRRTMVANADSSLLADGYKPSEQVFHAIQDGLGWFSLRGFFFSGAGPQATEGVSSESRFVLNPFLLVAPEFWGLSIWSQKPIKWDKNRVTDATLNDPQFPLMPRPESLSWYPKKAYAEVTYRITPYLSRLNEWTTSRVDLSNVDFGAVAYNAADLGLSYIYLNLKQSINIANPKQPKEPVEILESLGTAGKVCGVEAGCNHRMAPLAAFDSIKITALPAEAVFNLWSEENLDLGRPTMNFIVKFE